MGAWHYRAPVWLPGGSAQTLGAALWGRSSRVPALAFKRQRWLAPDGDFIDTDWLPGPPSATALVLFHGLEGSSRSHYAKSFAFEARRRGWAFVLPHFRGCSGPINLAPRAYHSGDHEEIGWMLRRVREQVGPSCRLYAVGVSLGGNALLRWAQEAGKAAGPAWAEVAAVAAVSAPLDLAAAGNAIDSGLNRWIYAQMFLRTMKHKARSKGQQFPGLFDLQRALGARTLREFDDAFTAPLHGFAGVDDYWKRASAKAGLARIELPALLLNARNDPLVPATSLPGAAEVGPAISLWQPDTGGHVGFPGALSWGLRGAQWDLQAMPAAVCAWLQAQPN
ncbi:MAG: alpha/beta fold hydrolase [Serpentinimonas sp.]|nr:alpha/beta fold hydrolase [Serpentinimonas sp.]